MRSNISGVARAVGRFSDRDGGARAGIPGEFPARARSRAVQGVRQPAALPVPRRVRPVRGISRAALPSDPHGLAWRALLDDRIGLVLCVALPPMGFAAVPDAWFRLSMADGGARTLQAAPHALRQAFRPLRGEREPIVST